MIQISKREFPNPVLAPGRDDYSNDSSYSFSVEADKITVDQENINIPVFFELSCPSIEKELLNGRMVAAVKVKSSASSYCRLIQFLPSERTKIIQVGKYTAVGCIELTGLILANTEMSHFSCPEMNPLYFSGVTFDFRKGDVIATDTPRIIYIDDSELEKPIASIFTINNGHDQDEQIEADFSDHKITINLQEDLNTMYWTLKDFNNGALRRYVLAVIVYPVLVEAIEKMKAFYGGQGEEDISELRWFRTIEFKASKLPHNPIEMSEFDGSSTMLANKLLGGISLDSLKSFKDMLDQEMNSGETQVIGGVD